MKTLISLSTYCKNLAADQLLETLFKYGYNKVADIHLADDNNGKAKEIANKYDIFYSTGHNIGVAGNKNRSLQFFFEHSEYDDILMLDDDLLFTKGGLIEHFKYVCENDLKLDFCGGYWSEKEVARLQFSGKTWEADFPVIAETTWCTFHKGAQGVALYVKRELAEKAQYFNVLPMKYGFEHSLYFSRLLRLSGHCPERFPVLKYCEEWFHGNTIPNNYEYAPPEKWNDYIQDVFKLNGQAHAKLLNEIYEGRSLRNWNSGLP